MNRVREAALVLAELGAAEGYSIVILIDGAATGLATIANLPDTRPLPDILESAAVEVRRQRKPTAR